MEIVTFCLIYLLSAFGYWKCINISFSKYGRWEVLSTGILELIVVFMPMTNTIWLIGEVLTGNIKRKKESYFDKYNFKKDINKYDKFFKIKN